MSAKPIASLLALTLLVLVLSGCGGESSEETVVQAQPQPILYEAKGSYINPVIALSAYELELPSLATLDQDGEPIREPGIAGPLGSRILYLAEPLELLFEAYPVVIEGESEPRNIPVFRDIAGGYLALKTEDHLAGVTLAVVTEDQAPRFDGPNEGRLTNLRVPEGTVVGVLQTNGLYSEVVYREPRGNRSLVPSTWLLSSHLSDDADPLAVAIIHNHYDRAQSLDSSPSVLDNFARMLAMDPTLSSHPYSQQVVATRLQAPSADLGDSEQTLEQSFRDQLPQSDLVVEAHFAPTDVIAIDDVTVYSQPPAIDGAAELGVLVQGSAAEILGVAVVFDSDLGLPRPFAQLVSPQVGWVDGLVISGIE